MDEKVGIGILVKMVNNTFEREMNNTILEIGLTSSQCHILKYLQENKDREVYPIDIENKFHFKRPTVTGLLKRLEDKEFIEIRAGEKDKRYKCIVLTKKSNEVSAMMKKNMQETEKRLCNGITAKEKDETRRILKKMLVNMTK